jgi:hypothetical protein
MLKDEIEKKTIFFKVMFYRTIFSEQGPMITPPQLVFAN